MQTLALIGLPIIFGISGQLLLKTGMMQIGKFALMHHGILLQMLKIFMNPYVFLGFCSYAMGSIVWIVTLSRVPLSFAYPMLSVNYVGVLLAAQFIFHEPVSPIRWLGVVIICFGVMLIGRS